MTETPPTTEEFWESFFRERPVWSGQPNALLVREVTGLPPGRALDLGCGEGGDAVWLAQQGWRVTAADVAPSALARGAERARAAGVDDRIRFEQHNLFRTFPEGSYDLVSAQFFHSPIDVSDEREDVLRRAAAAVAPGGVLLIVGHASFPAWHEPPAGVRLPSTTEVLDTLAPDPGEWAVEREELLSSEITGHAGEVGTREDNLLRLRRLT